ncbi:MAG TPA: hypothetical protein VF521_19700 [Pyrinomonadaceae bacterium]
MKRTSLLVFILASLVVGGACWTRARAASAPAAAATAPPIPSPTRAIDEYGDVPFDDEKARLDNFAIEVQNDPTAVGHLTCYGGRVERKGEAQRRCARAKNYLVNYRGISADRIVTVDGGYREELTVVLWVVPPGASAPQPSPTVDAGEVRFVRGKPRRGPRTRR